MAKGKKDKLAWRIENWSERARSEWVGIEKELNLVWQNWQPVLHSLLKASRGMRKTLSPLLTELGSAYVRVRKGELPEKATRAR